ncbi:hypothetical protein EYZ11_006496 [Aspergillus tanneri]|nr:hypothetical protein EYZ11_006496 [Aspergillus tanneri]
MGVSRTRGQMSAKGVPIAAVVVTWVHKRPLGADPDAVLVLVGALPVQLRAWVTAVGCNRGP